MMRLEFYKIAFFTRSVMLQILRCDATPSDTGCLQKRKNNADARMDWLRAMFFTAGEPICIISTRSRSLSDKCKLSLFFRRC